MGDDPTIGRDQGTMVTDNGLSLNGLSLNGLSLNGLSLNGLSLNGLSLNGTDEGIVWTLNEAAAGDMTDTESGREVLQYVARCALLEGDYLRIESNGETWDYPGVLGLAPEWASGPLSTEGKELVSACLLAHVNAFDISVPISLRSSHLPAATAQETGTYFYGDGAFFGNLFVEVPEVYSCKIRGREYLDPAAGALVSPSSPNADDRVCADESTAAECEMVYTGYCDQVCGVVEQDGNQWRFSDCLGADGVRYSQTISVWLQGSDAETCASAPAGFTCDPNLLMI